MEVSGAYGFGPPQNSEASPPLVASTSRFDISSDLFVVIRFLPLGVLANELESWKKLSIRYAEIDLSVSGFAKLKKKRDGSLVC